MCVAASSTVKLCLDKWVPKDNNTVYNDYLWDNISFSKSSYVYPMKAAELSFEE